MLKDLLKNRVFVVGLMVFVCFVGGCLLYLWHVAREGAEEIAATETIARRFNEKQNPPSSAETPVAEDTEQGGHWHGDHWHADPHPAMTPPSEPTPTKAIKSVTVQRPEGLTNPDEIAAWDQLEAIAADPFQWGGQLSTRATELMAELTPMWQLGPTPADCGEELMMTLDILAAERDPRSAETLLTYQLDSGVSGRPIREALAAMGPASLPSLIARLNPEETAEVFYGPIIRDVVVPIVEQHKTEIRGIIEHIIIPRLEAIAAKGTGDTWEGHERGNSIRSRRALARLKE